MSQVIHSAGSACRDCGEAVGNVHRWSCGRYRVGEVAGRLVESVECGPLRANAIVGVDPLRSAAADDAVVAVPLYAAADPAALDAPLGGHTAPLGGHTASDHAALREQARLAAKHRLAPYLDGPMKAASASAAMALVDEPRVKACVACKWSKVMAGSKGLLCHYNPPGPAGFPPVLATDWCREFSVGGQ